MLYSDASAVTEEGFKFHPLILYLISPFIHRSYIRLAEVPVLDGTRLGLLPRKDKARLGPWTTMSFSCMAAILCPCRILSLNALCYRLSKINQRVFYDTIDKAIEGLRDMSYKQIVPVPAPSTSLLWFQDVPGNGHALATLHACLHGAC